MSPATNAIQVMLMTPSANSDAMSAQQQPTHQAPFFAPIRSAPERPVAPGAEQEPERAAALAEADVLQRGELVDRRDDEGGPGEPPAGVVPGQDVARRSGSATTRDREGGQTPAAAQVSR